MASGGPIRVMVVDDQWMIREGLASLAGIEDDIDVVAVAADGREAVARAEQERPDVVLMDIQMPGLDGIAATEAIRATNPDINVLMLTTFDDHDLIERSLAAGAVGYLTKDIAANDLAQSIRSAAAGLVQMSPDVTRILLDRRSAAPSDQGADAATTPDTAPDAAGELAELTPREREVLTLVARGLSNREIGRELHLSAGTVKNHVSAILRRLGISDRTQAAVIAARNGLV
ncbi:MAG: response regulator transcription factor [Actinomycetota bacterium]